MPRGDQFIRQWSIFKALSSKHLGMTVEDLAAEFGVTRRTVYRDLGVLQAARMPVVSEMRGGKAYYSVRTEDSGKLYGLFSKPELISLSFAKSMVDFLEGTPLKTAFADVVAKVRRNVHGSRAELERAEKTYLARFGSLRDYKPFARAIDRVQSAVASCRTLEFAYRPLHSETPVKYKVDPYGILYYGGALYVVGYSHASKGIRSFKIDRMDPSHVLAAGSFEPPEGFSLDEFFSQDFGIWHGDKAEDVRIEFSSGAARAIRERVWHRSQKLKELSGGRVLLAMRVAGLEEVKWWVLSFGGSARVLRPKRLASDVKKELKAALARY